MDLAQLNLAVKSVERVSVVEAEGELGPWTNEALGKALHSAAGSDCETVILDLTQVKSMDVGALKVLKEVCAALGPDRRLCAIACGDARRLLELTRFDEMISVYPRISDAIETGTVT